MTLLVNKSNFSTALLSTFSLAVLSACGSSDSVTSSSESTPYAATTPAPLVTQSPSETMTTTFPTQVNKPTISVINDSGSLIIAESGLSLYTFDNDSINTSRCVGSSEANSCAAKWPPLLAGDGAVANNNMTIITRDTGDKQWAYKGLPLYQWVNDNAQGDISGDGGIWHLARPMPLTSSTINGVATYVGNKTISSITENAMSVRLNKDGFTLYTFDTDPLNDSVCVDECIKNWPPLLADAGAMAMPPLTIITTSNGNEQWALNGKPLYFFKNDTARGETNGEGLGGVWHIASSAVEGVDNNNNNNNNNNDDGNDSGGYNY